MWPRFIGFFLSSSLKLRRRSGSTWGCFTGFFSSSSLKLRRRSGSMGGCFTGFFFSSSLKLSRPASSFFFFRIADHSLDLLVDLVDVPLYVCRATKELTEDVINFGNKVSEKGTNHHTTAYKIAQINKEKQQVLEFEAEHTSIVSREEFYKLAPNRLKELADKNEHSLRLAQLEFELQERKLLAIELKEHKEKRSKLNQKIADLEDRERESVEGLKNLVETCKPFVESLDLSEADFGNTIVFAPSIETMSIPLESLYRQAKAREAQLGDFECFFKEEELQISYSDFTIRLLYCPKLERVLAKCDKPVLLDSVNPSDDGLGLPNLYGVSDRNDELMRQWHESGWKCYRWLQNIAGIELMLDECEVTSNAIDLNDVLDHLITA
ncbi:Oidioi.mRNA.OKI2018_I69.XSR.g17002.t1.cds [Oikopleura dioica]|uniref:Oidioi.mRNA.OKI2018_I69.XSR.g17002.t1.cds n=1 Tax=Oikopleura dioica TaxID=34765 RepID=A0ABN7SLN9_OIKDI|nr:Oidioi.mRNA.OKI2018_I69.XSR.g17002.t1.cds [Oikopleura dioica]